MNEFFSDIIKEYNKRIMEQIKKNITYKVLKNAFAGLNYFFRNERNGRTQFIIAVFTVILGIFLNITKQEDNLFALV